MGVGEGGWVVSAPTPHALASTPERHHTRSAPSPEARGPPLGGSMRPCAAACLRGHTTWLGGVAAWFDGGFPWVQSRRALAHLSRRRREIRRSGALDGLVAQGSAPCAHALRASACATAEGAGGASARSQRAHIAHLWDVDGEEAAGSHAWAATRSACSRRARTLRRGVLAEGEMSGRIPHGRWRAGGGLGAVLGARRGVGGDARGAVAVSLAREDHTTTKEQSLVGFGTLGKLRASAIFSFAKRVCRVVTNLSFLCARTY